jgi:hypothetical protein
LVIYLSGNIQKDLDDSSVSVKNTDPKDANSSPQLTGADAFYYNATLKFISQHEFLEMQKVKVTMEFTLTINF